MIDAIIVDDERNAITALKNDLEMYCPEVDIKAAFTKASDALSYLKLHQPQVIFLDIDLPLMNGFDFVAGLEKPLRSHIIFVTAYSDFAIRAFKVEALDYLLKPVDPDDLRRAVQKASKKPHDEALNLPSKSLSELQASEAIKTKIALPVNNGYHLIDPMHIIYCKAAGAYTQVILDNDKSLLISKNLGRTQEILPKDVFERTHQSYLINLNHIKMFRKGEASEAVMANNDVIKVSRLNKDRLVQLLGIQ